jgi:hypothetical protein
VPLKNRAVENCAPLDKLIRKNREAYAKCLALGSDPG